MLVIFLSLLQFPRESCRRDARWRRTHSLPWPTARHSSSKTIAMSLCLSNSSRRYSFIYPPLYCDSFIITPPVETVPGAVPLIPWGGFHSGRDDNTNVLLHLLSSLVLFSGWFLSSRCVTGFYCIVYWSYPRLLYSPPFREQIPLSPSVEVWVGSGFYIIPHHDVIYLNTLSLLFMELYKAVLCSLPLCVESILREFERVLIWSGLHVFFLLQDRCC